MSAEIIVLAQARRTLQVETPEIASSSRSQLERRRDNRKAQYDLWRKAVSLAGFFMALRQLQLAATVGERYGHAEAAFMHEQVGDYNRLLDEGRKAEARCVLTPAPSRKEIEWKRIALRRDRHILDYISEAEALAAIDADEKWHDENPYRRQQR